MREIDFSSKHHILIENADGTTQPMDVPFFETEQVAPGVWRNLTDGDYFYLIEGEQEAIAIDTGYGCGNVREFLQSLTQQPVKNVINTHNHFDHTANNGYFECAYMTEDTRPLATIPFYSFEGIDFPRDYPVKIVKEGDTLDLGNRPLEFFQIPDHSPGGLCILDKKERLLFTGDELAMPNGKMLNGSVERFAGYMEKLIARRGEFDKLCAGFGVFDASILEKYLENARHIMAGNVGVELPPSNFPPVEDPAKGPVTFKRMHARPCDLPAHVRQPEANVNKRSMEYAGCRIVYDITKIFEEK